MMDIEPIMLSAKDAAKLLGIGVSLFNGMAANGKLGPQPVHFSRRVLWRRKELEAWTDSGCPARTIWDEIMAAKNFEKF